LSKCSSSSDNDEVLIVDLTAPVRVGEPGWVEFGSFGESEEYQKYAIKPAGF